MKNKRTATIVILAVVLMLVMTPVFAQNLPVAVNHSSIIAYPGVERVAVANPDIADVAVVSGSEVVVIGKAPGITTLHIWSAAGRVSYEVEVGANDKMIADNIKSILNYPDITVSKVGKTVILEGRVHDQYQKSRAEKVAAAYGEKVVNLLELTSPKQVKIEARILEIQKDKTDSLGITWGSAPLTKDGKIFNPNVYWIGQSQANAKLPNAFGNFGTYADINASINALVENGYAKVLSQPNMITINGEKANILVGGEIPIPVALDGNRITVEWKEYGIKLAIAPEVSAEGLIASKVTAEVSSIDYGSAARINIGNGLVIPPLKTRKAETVITMPSGQTMAIGGLISSEDTKNAARFPFLSDLPILGKLFTSESFTTGKTEVIFIITPTLVDAAAYKPQTSETMKEFITEKPWSVERNDEKKQGANHK